MDDARAEAIAEESVHRFGRMLIEVLKYPLINRDNFRQLVHFEGLENLEKSLCRGQGRDHGTAHYGNWEMLGASMALLGYPILSITRRQNNGAMDKFINDYRQMVGQHVTYNHGENSMLAIGRYLKKETSGGDPLRPGFRSYGRTPAVLRQTFPVPQGAAHLSRMFGSPIVPLLCTTIRTGP